MEQLGAQSAHAAFDTPAGAGLRRVGGRATMDR